MAADPLLAVSAALPSPGPALATVLDQAATVVAREYDFFGVKEQKWRRVHGFCARRSPRQGARVGSRSSCQPPF